MIKELINFTKEIDSEIADTSKEFTKGVHIFLDQNKTGELYVTKVFDNDSTVESDDLLKILNYEKYSAYLNMNKQQKFDKSQKIHSANPFCFAFNFSLGNNKKEIEDVRAEKLKVQKNKFKCTTF